jgi:hypothetical protein
MKNEIVCFDGTSVAIIRHHSFQGIIIDGEFTIIPRRISHAKLLEIHGLYVTNIHHRQRTRSWLSTVICLSNLC